jgi:uncharacterized protein
MTIIIGLIIGLVLGLTGSGGSVFAVPLLILLLHLPINEASGIALAAVAASAGVGAVQRIITKQVQWIPAIFLMISGALTAPVGKWLAQQIPGAYLTAGFSVLALLIAIKMWKSAQNKNESTILRAEADFLSTPRELMCQFSPEAKTRFKPRCFIGLIGGGLSIGLLSGLFGVGGGFLIVPLLLFMTDMSYAAAVAVSLVVITCISSVGFTSYLFFTNVIPVELMLQVSVGGVIGMMLGFVLAKKVSGSRLQKIFSVSLGLMAITLWLT